jgi:hypothetical protein
MTHIFPKMSHNKEMKQMGQDKEMKQMGQDEKEIQDRDPAR